MPSQRFKQSSRCKRSVKARWTPSHPLLLYSGSPGACPVVCCPDPLGAVEADSLCVVEREHCCASSLTWTLGSHVHKLEEIMEQKAVCVRSLRSLLQPYLTQLKNPCWKLLVIFNSWSEFQFSSVSELKAEFTPNQANNLCGCGVNLCGVSCILLNSSLQEQTLIVSTFVIKALYYFSLYHK